MVMSSEQRLLERLQYVGVRLLALAALALALGIALQAVVDRGPAGTAAGGLRSAVAAGVPAARASGARVLLRRVHPRRGFVCRGAAAPVVISKQDGRWRATGSARAVWARSVAHRC
jgi:hypothetical protein